MTAMSPTAAAQAARSVEFPREAGDDSVEKKKTTVQLAIEDDLATIDEVIVLTATDSASTVVTSSSPDSYESANEIPIVENGDAHDGKRGIKEEDESALETPNHDKANPGRIENASASLNPAPEEESDDTSTHEVTAVLKDDQSTPHAVQDPSTKITATPEQLAESPDALKDDTKALSSSENALKKSSTSRTISERSSIPTETISSTTSSTHIEGGLGNSTDHARKTLQLLHFNDDPSHYDGDALWTCILNRCVEWFNTGQALLGPAYLALQKLRLGKCDAETALKQLCEIAKREPNYCLVFQAILGILERYPGSSLLQAPFVTFSTSSKVQLTKPQASCLTCVKHDESCRGTKMTNGRCETCHHKKLNAPPGVQVDECRWEDAKFGIFNWEDAELLFGVSSDTTISQSSNMKRKALDQPIAARPTKRGSSVNAGSNMSGAEKPEQDATLVRIRGLGLQPRYIQQPSTSGDNLLPPFSLKSEVVVRSATSYVGSRDNIISANEWKSVKAALLWNAWQSIRLLKQARLFAGRPTYTFGIKRRKLDKQKVIGDVDLLWLDREIRAGNLERFKTMASWIFVCTARPAEKTI